MTICTSCDYNDYETYLRQGNADTLEQRTVGIVSHNGKTYEADWMYAPGEDGKIVAAEHVGFIFLDGKQLTEFCNWRPGSDGWTNLSDFMADAEDFITSGDLQEVLDWLANREWAKKG